MNEKDREEGESGRDSRRKRGEGEGEREREGGVWKVIQMINMEQVAFQK